MGRPAKKKTLDDGTPNSSSAKYTPEEIALLDKLIIEHQNVLLSARTDAVSNEARNQTWKEVAHKFNAQCLNVVRILFSVFFFLLVLMCFSFSFSFAPKVRTADSLKMKFKNEKREMRKEAATERRQILSTGGGAYKLPEHRQREGRAQLQSLLKVSIHGNASTFDDDALPNNSSVLLASSDDTSAYNFDADEFLTEAELQFIEPTDDAEEETLLENANVSVVTTTSGAFAAIAGNTQSSTVDVTSGLTFTSSNDASGAGTDQFSSVENSNELMLTILSPDGTESTPTILSTPTHDLSGPSWSKYSSSMLRSKPNPVLKRKRNAAHETMPTSDFNELSARSKLLMVTSEMSAERHTQTLSFAAEKHRAELEEIQQRMAAQRSIDELRLEEHRIKVEKVRLVFEEEKLAAGIRIRALRAQLAAMPQEEVITTEAADKHDQSSEGK